MWGLHSIVGIFSAPRGATVPVNVTDNGNGSLSAEYIPTDVGQ